MKKFNGRSGDRQWVQATVGFRLFPRMRSVELYNTISDSTLVEAPASLISMHG